MKDERESRFSGLALAPFPVLMGPFPIRITKLTPNKKAFVKKGEGVSAKSDQLPLAL